MIHKGLSAFLDGIFLSLYGVNLRVCGCESEEFLYLSSSKCTLTPSS